MRTIDKNLADWYRKATPKHRKHGRAWYQDAHRFARGLSRTTGLDFPRVVGVIAAAPAMYEALQNLLEWSKGNREAREGNPYCKPEVRQALKVLASIQDKKDYIDADTAPQAEGQHHE